MSETQAGGPVDRDVWPQPLMSNGELAEAIAAARSMVWSTAQQSQAFPVLLDHLQKLLLIQQSRAAWAGLGPNAELSGAGSGAATEPGRSPASDLSA